MSGGSLKRELGLFGAVLMGLGSIVGTGVFVSIGVAAGIAGPAVVLAIAVAGCVAACNALSSAQLAARHPVSGGTYEYGYLYLSPELGFTAGWMFLCAKTASAATAALGFAGYLLHTSGWTDTHPAPVAVASALVLTAVVLCGLRRSSVANAIIVGVTVLALAAFVLAGLPAVWQDGGARFDPFFGGDEAPWRAFPHATALMFVAYTGYGRISTMGEEVREPRRTIPRAIVITLGVSAVLYIAVGLVAVAVAGPAALEEATHGQAAPLEVAARGFAQSWVRWLVALGAMTAMLGVLLNLILGLSRVLLAMARRRDAPVVFARLSAGKATPVSAVLAVGVAIAVLAGLGGVRTTWSFSAFTVLVYYALTNLCALRMLPSDRLYPRAFAWCGLASCLFLAFWVETEIWAAGLGLLAAGLVWHLVARRLAARI